MLNSYNDLKTFSIRAMDERTGNVDDIYFDDESWKIRYLVAHTGFLLTSRQSLVGASRLEVPDTELREFPVDLTSEELKSADAKETHAPVSEQVQPTTAAESMAAWPSFVVGPGGAYTPAIAQEQLDRATRRAVDRRREAGDPHLRSMAEVIGYRVHATDDEIGSVNDFLIDPESWQLKHLVIDTGTWLPGKRVVITTDWITDVDWAGQRIHVNVDTQKIKDAPPFEDVEELKRSQHPEAMASYSALGYWPI